MAIESINGKRARAEDLLLYVERLFTALEVDQPSASAVARAVIDASARGVDTHGIRLVPWYIKMVEGGRINRRPNVTFTRRAAAAGHVDSDDGFGHRASFLAIEEGCRIAAETGIAAVTVGRSTHHGATGVYSLAAARNGFAAFGVTHADSMVVPYGATKSFYGTNPISFAVPVAGGEPMLLDMATSAIPFNRVHLRRATGTPLPPEVAVDAEGETTVDPFAAAALHPLGGDGFGYKGAGLAAMVDLLCSAFTGMGHSATLAPLGGPDYSRPIPLGHFFILFAPGQFQPQPAFDDRVSSFLGDLRRTPAKPGRQVMAPGDVENAEAAERRRLGIPVDDVTWKGMASAAERLGVAIPSAVEATADAHGA